jgi:ribosomal subunit interface protein
MNIRIACRGTIEHTEQLDQHIRKQLAKIIKFFEQEQEPVTIDIVLDGHPNHAHNSMRLHAIAAKFEVVVSREDQNIYAVVDKVIDIAYETLHKQKEKLVHDKKNSGPGHGPHRNT